MLRFPALLLSALLVATPLVAQETGEFALKEADHKKLGKPFGKWFDAKLAGDFSKESDARTDLIKECDDFDKKLKTLQVLSLVRDWEAILDLGREFATSGALVKKGKAYELPSSGDQTFAVRLPAAYNPKKESYTSILILAAGKATDTIEALPEEWKDRFILLAVDLTGLDAESLFHDAGLARVLTPIGTASRHFRMDRRRLFLLGTGDFGAAAASRIAAAYPMAFAGCALVDGESTATLNAGNLKLLPFDKKSDTVTALTWFTELPMRTAYPLNFEVTLTEQKLGRHFWVQALRFDPPEAVPAGKVARFKVSVDKATNTITLESEFVYRYKLFLNDEIVNLDEEIKIVRNGEVYRYQAVRSVGTLLDNFASTLDAGMVFPAWLQQVDVPIPEAAGEGR